jgi:hypothetical protein
MLLMRISKAEKKRGGILKLRGRDSVHLQEWILTRPMGCWRAKRRAVERRAGVETRRRAIMKGKSGEVVSWSKEVRISPLIK